jgi:hypothetical protein
MAELNHNAIPLEAPARSSRLPRLLWIGVAYSNGGQHQCLWSPGNVPAGEQFSTPKRFVGKAPGQDVPVSDDSDMKK